MSSDKVLAENVMAALASVVDAAKISGLTCHNGQVTFAIEVDPSEGAKLEPLRQRAAAVAEQVEGVKHVTAVLTAERATPPARRPWG